MSGTSGAYMVRDGADAPPHHEVRDLLRCSAISGCFQLSPPALCLIAG